MVASAIGPKAAMPDRRISARASPSPSCSRSGWPALARTDCRTMTRRSLVLASAGTAASALLVAFLVFGSGSGKSGAAVAGCGVDPPDGQGAATAGMAFIPGGGFTMGADDQRPEERWAHR